MIKYAINAEMISCSLSISGIDLSGTVTNFSLSWQMAKKICINHLQNARRNLPWQIADVILILIEHAEDQVLMAMDNVKLNQTAIMLFRHKPHA